jgi:hypothetical protein
LTPEFKKKFNKVIDVTRAIAACILLVAVIFSYPIAYRTSSEVVTITISDKERVTVKNGDSITNKYLVFTEAGEVFENTDSLLYLKFSSSDVQGHLRNGEKYEVKVAGWRIPFISSYRNIISVVSDIK